MSDLPAGWTWVTLNDLQADEPRAITDGPFGSNLTSAHYSDSGARVIRLQNIGDGQFLDAEAYVPMSHFETLRSHEARPGDLIIASLGQVLPKACIVPVNLGPAIVKADCIRVRLGRRVDHRWALYAMQTPSVRRWAGEQLHGVGRPRLGLKVIRELPIPLPPIEEQRRIVDILEDHLSRLDVAERNLRSAESRLQALASSAAETAARGLFDVNSVAPDVKPRQGSPDVTSRTPAVASWLPDWRLPISWKWASLDELSEFVLDGDHNPPKRVPAGIPHITAKGIRDGQISFDGCTFVSDEGFAQTSARYLPQASDVIVTCVGTIGRVAVVPSGIRFSADRNLAAARLLPGGVLPEFLALVLNSYTLQRRMHRASGSTAQPHLYLKDLRALPVPVPPIDDQRAAVRLASELNEGRRRLLTQILSGQTYAARLRQALLQHAFAGRLTAAAPDAGPLEELARV